MKRKDVRWKEMPRCSLVPKKKKTGGGEAAQRKSGERGRGDKASGTEAKLLELVGTGGK